MPAWNGKSREVRGRASWLPSLLLLLCLMPVGALGHPPSPGDDSIKARLKTCLLTGDMACVVDQYLLLKDIGRLLGFNETAHGVLVRSHQVALTGQHVAIKWEGKVIDAYTGLGGLPVSEYMARLGTSATSHVIYEVTSTP